MKIALVLSAAAGVLAFSLMFSQARGEHRGPRPARATRPVVVELFTSEGCSSCPAADRTLAQLASEQPVEGAHIVPLELHVDYWDGLGWKDPFASAAYTERQAAYASKHVYTPQMIVAGGEEFVGSDGKRARAAIARAAAAAESLPLELHVARAKAEGVVDVAVDVPAHAAAADLWLAVSEGGLATDVAHGENAGERLVHAPVVRYLHDAAALPASTTASTTHASITIASAWKRANLRVVAFVQNPGPGAIVGAAESRLP